MNKIPNRQAICDVLMLKAETDKDIVVLCSDSRGSASMTEFFEKYKEQTVELGIAEQNLVSIAAGLAKCGKKSFCFSPACFLSARSYEQAKIDVAYSNTNVKLVGISGGISYGELGMSHHSLQDIAAMCALPNMRVYLPSDRFQTTKLFEHLTNDDKPAYIRVGRNPVEDIYSEQDCPFTMDKAVTKVFLPDQPRKAVTIVAAGEMVGAAFSAAAYLSAEGIKATVLDMYCLKPFDSDSLINSARVSDLVISIEEHSPYGGLGAMTALTLSTKCPKKLIHMALPDDCVITGKSQDVFNYYGLNSEGIIKNVLSNL